MAEKNPGAGSTGKEFDEFLADCPKADEAASSIIVAGAVMRSQDDKTFVLQTAGGENQELPRAAVQKFERLQGGSGLRMTAVTLDPAKLDQAVIDRLQGSLKPLPADTSPLLDKSPPADKFPPQDKFPPLDKNPPFDTLKEPLDDTFKEPPFETLKEPPSDTFKEQPFDTLKEIGGGDTIKELPGDTFKEGPGDTLKEGAGDTLVEVPGMPGGGVVQPEAMARAAQPQALSPGNFTAQTLKELAPETIKEIINDPTLKEAVGDPTIKEAVNDPTLKELTKDPIGEGTGIADTFVETVPGLPGGGMIQPEQMLAARMAQPQAAAAGFGQAANAAALKPFAADTAKEMANEFTLKELIADQTIKEILKEVVFEGTGIADSLVEGTPGFPGGGVIDPSLGMATAGAPFVLATPHQASQGAVAQQMLAAQAMQGRLGF